MDDKEFEKFLTFEMVMYYIISFLVGIIVGFICCIIFGSIKLI